MEWAKLSSIAVASQVQHDHLRPTNLTQCQSNKRGSQQSEMLKCQRIYRPGGEEIKRGKRLGKKHDHNVKMVTDNNNSNNNKIEATEKYAKKFDTRHDGNGGQNHMHLLQKMPAKKMLPTCLVFGWKFLSFFSLFAGKFLPSITPPLSLSLSLTTRKIFHLCTFMKRENTTMHI